MKNKPEKQRNKKQQLKPQLKPLKTATKLLVVDPYSKALSKFPATTNLQYDSKEGGVARSFVIQGP